MVADLDISGRGQVHPPPLILDETEAQRVSTPAYHEIRMRHFEVHHFFENLAKFYLLSILFNRPPKLVCFVFPMMPLCRFINLCMYMHGNTGFALLHLSYIVLALSSTVTKLPNKSLIFHDFQGLTIKFYDIPGLENEILKLHDFPSFALPVRTLEIR